MPIVTKRLPRCKPAASAAVLLSERPLRSAMGRIEVPMAICPKYFEGSVVAEDEAL